jgi:hypothetical protein
MLSFPGARHWVDHLLSSELTRRLLHRALITQFDRAEFEPKSTESRSFIMRRTIARLKFLGLKVRVCEDAEARVSALD